MTDHTYNIIELAGSSETSHADAIENAIAPASKTTCHLRCFRSRNCAARSRMGKSATIM